MSRIFCYFFLLAFVANTFIVLPTGASLLNSETDSLIVGVVRQDNFPLVYFDEKSTPKGFEVTMVRHLAKAGGFEPLEIRKFPDQESLRRALSDHEIDFAFSKMKQNSADAEQFIYSKPHLAINYVFLINRKVISANKIQIDPVKSIAFSDLIIGTLNNPLYADQLRSSYPENNIKLFSSKQDIFDAVLSGEIAACYLDEIEAKNFFLNSPDQAIRLQFLKSDTATEYVSLIFPWDKLFFREWVNIFLTKEGYTRTQLSEVINQYSSDLIDMQN